MKKFTHIIVLPILVFILTVWVGSSASPSPAQADGPVEVIVSTTSATTEATTEATPSPSPETTNEPTEEATTEPTAEPPSEEPTKEATDTSPPETTNEPTAEATPSPSPEITDELTEEATETPSPETTAPKVEIEPTEEAANQPAQTPPVENQGDVNGDNVVNILDLAFIAARYGSPDPMADINADGVVDISDLVIAAGKYGQDTNIKIPLPTKTPPSTPSDIQAPTPSSTPSPIAENETSNNKPMNKLSFRLTLLTQPDIQIQSEEDQAISLGVSVQGAGSLVRNQNDRLLVYIRLSDISGDNIQELINNDVQVVHVADEYRIVTAFIHPDKLLDITAISTVENIQEVLRPEASGMIAGLMKTDKTGLAHPSAQADCLSATTSEGDVQLKADEARSHFGLDGSGVTVGVLSDSYNNHEGVPVPPDTIASTDIATGDLPGFGNPCGRSTAVNIIKEGISPSDPELIDEGRAMLQIIHDLAPGANLAFATAFDGLFDFAQQIQNLQTDAGTNIIVDDIAYLNEPFFQDGPVTLAINSVTANGSLYFTAVGNDNLLDPATGNSAGSYEAPAYRPMACPAIFGVGDCHDFASGPALDNTSSYVLVPGASVGIILQWAEPWYGVTSDIDIYLLDDTTGGVLAFGVDINPGVGGTQQPFEFISYTNSTGATQFVSVVINRFAGITTPRLKYILIDGSGPSFVEYNVSGLGDIVGPSIYGHAMASAAVSVGAVPFNDDTSPADFSSVGSSTLYFGPTIGASPAPPIAPQIRIKPDIGATSGGLNTFFGTFDSAAGLWRFGGTSAAAPHTAAVAALMHQQADLTGVTLSQPMVEDILEKTAAPMLNGVPAANGTGLVDAFCAVTGVNNPPGNSTIEVRACEDTNSPDGDCTGEPPLTGINVNACLNDTDNCQPVPATFQCLPPGNYSVFLDNPDSNYRVTSPPAPVNIVPGASELVELGVVKEDQFHYLTGRVTEYVRHCSSYYYYHSYCYSVRQPVYGVTMRAVSSDGTVYTTYTQYGYFTFRLPAGSYTLTPLKYRYSFWPSLSIVNLSQNTNRFFNGYRWYGYSYLAARSSTVEEQVDTGVFFGGKISQAIIATGSEVSPSANSDGAAPEILIEGLDENTIVRGVINIEGIARGHASEIERVEIRVDDQTEPHLANLDGERYSWGLDTTQYSDGEHMLLVIAHDHNGNLNADVRTIMIDNGTGADITPPDVSIDTLAEEAIVGGNFILEGQVTDESGIERVEIWVDDQTEPYYANLDGDGYSWVLETTQYNNGQHTLAVIVFDKNGNSNGDARTFTIQN